MTADYPHAEKLAPGVTRLITSATELTPDAKISCISKLDALLAEGKLEHTDLPREPGVNFNPLPARLLEIILRESKISDETILLASLNGTEDPIAILAFHLDRLRHLHRLPIERDQKTADLAEATSALELHRESASRLSPRLVTLLEAAIERTGRLVQQQS